MIDEQFKLAIAMTSEAFLFAVNGRYFGNFKYRSPHVLDSMNGFRIFSMLGMQVEITSVDHIHMGLSDCTGFYEYSHPDVEIM